MNLESRGLLWLTAMTSYSRSERWVSPKRNNCVFQIHIGFLFDLQILLPRVIV